VADNLAARAAALRARVEADRTTCKERRITNDAYWDWRDRLAFERWPAYIDLALAEIGRAEQALRWAESDPIENLGEAAAILERLEASLGGGK
jgi:hypothetical protein